MKCRCLCNRWHSDSTDMRLILQTGNPAWGLPVKQGNCKDITINYFMPASLHILSSSWFADHPIFWYPIIWATESIVKWTTNENNHVPGLSVKFVV
jgi:hypothetical protein